MIHVCRDFTHAKVRSNGDCTNWKIKCKTAISCVSIPYNVVNNNYSKWFFKDILLLIYTNYYVDKWNKVLQASSKAKRIL